MIDADILNDLSEEELLQLYDFINDLKSRKREVKLSA